MAEGMTAARGMERNAERLGKHKCDVRTVSNLAIQPIRSRAPGGTAADLSARKHQNKPTISVSQFVFLLRVCQCGGKSDELENDGGGGGDGGTPFRARGAGLYAPDA